MESRLTKWGQAATIVVLVAVSIAVMLSYYQRTHLFPQGERGEGRILPANVAMHTKGFYYSQSENGQVTFDVTADVNLGYKDNKNLLEQVKVRVLGKSGNRYDTIMSQHCEFDQGSQDIVFLGKVVITLSSLSPMQNLSVVRPSEETSTILRLERIKYSQSKNLAETDDVVHFFRARMHGSCRGLAYDTRTGSVRLRSDVDITVDPEKPEDPPIQLKSSSLDYSKELNLVEIHSNVSVTKALDEVRADLVRVFLDKADSSVQRVEARGQVQSIFRDPRYLLEMDAQQVSYYLFGGGRWIDRIVAHDNVKTRSLDSSVKRNLSAQNLEITFTPQTNFAQKVKASGEVRCVFSDSIEPSPGPAPSNLEGFEAGDKVLDSPLVVATLKSDGRQVSRVTAQGPSVLREFPVGPKEEKKRLSAKAIEFLFSSKTNTLEKLIANNQVKVDLIPESGSAKKTLSDRLEATFDQETHQIDHLEQSGNFHYFEGQREATADQAHYSTATDTAVLDGHAQFHDAQGRTVADVIELHKQEDLVKARGLVRSVMVSMDSPTQAGLFKTSSPVFASSDFMESHTRSGIAKYWSKAKLWQEDQVVRAQTITLFRDERKMVAETDVHTVFHLKPQPQHGQRQRNSGPVMAEAAHLVYEDNLQRARFETRVKVIGPMGQMTADQADLFLSKEGDQTTISRMLAQGNVKIQQEGRNSFSSTAEYFAADGMVVLTGGPPRIIDPVRGFSSGPRLTMYLNDDRIAVEGDSEMRTITRQNVAR